MNPDNLAENGGFSCSRCGLCCRCVRRSEATIWLDRGDGVCSNLDESSNLCRIYAMRPMVCRVDAMYPAFESILTKEEYIAENMRVCETLKLEKSEIVTRILLRE